MAKFKIELETDIGRVILTDFDSKNENNLEMTFDESLEEGENDTYTLSFSIPKKIDGIPIGNLIAINRPLWLTFGHPERAVRMAISSIAEGQGESNKIFEVEAQDYASYIYSKNNAGLSFDSFEDEDFLRKLKRRSIEKPTIIDIAEYVLERGWLRKETETNQEDQDYSGHTSEGWNVEYIRNEDNVGIPEQYFKYANIEVDNSNTYNALIELANASQTIIRFEYDPYTKYGTVKFIDKEDKELDKKFLLREDFNLEQLSLSEEGEELFGLLYIEGIQDESGEYVFAGGDINYRDNFIYELNYFQNKGLITPQQRLSIDRKIKGDGSTESELLAINKKLETAIQLRYHLEEKIRQMETEIETRSYKVLVEPSAEDFTKDYQFFRKIFIDKIRDQSSGSSSGGPGSEYRLEEFVEVDENGRPDDNIADEFEVLRVDKALIKFNGSYLSLSGEKNLTNPILLRIEGKDYEVMFATENGIIPDGYVAEKTWNYSNGTKILLLVKPDSGQSWNDNYEEYFKLEKIWFELVYLGRVPATISTYPYYDLLYQLGGRGMITEKVGEWNQKVEDVKKEWRVAIHELHELNEKNAPNTGVGLSVEEKQREAYLKDQIEAYRLMIGEYKLKDGTTGEDILDEDKWELEEGYLGYYTLVQKTMNEVYSYYDPEKLEDDDVLRVLDRLQKEKRDFWYNMRDKYGAHIFTEGYYEDEIETDPLILFHQAKRAYEDHNKPIEQIQATYINLSDIVGINILEPRVGDYIWIQKRDEEVQSDKRLKVESVSRTLRLDGSIEYEIAKFNPGNRLIEKLVKQLQG